MRDFLSSNRIEQSSFGGAETHVSERSNLHFMKFSDQLLAPTSARGLVGGALCSVAWWRKESQGPIGDCRCS